jgi:hypothetical protein
MYQFLPDLPQAQWALMECIHLDHLHSSLVGAVNGAFVADH